MLNFVLIGAAGFVAPRHMKAIKEVGGNLIAAYDPKDSVGILDSYFPNCQFFTDLEGLGLYLEQVTHGHKINYVCICSPNHLHLSHIAFGLRVAENVICEKPLVLNVDELTQVEELEKRYGGRVFTILQLRLHPVLLELKNGLKEHNTVSLNYSTPRGDWYGKSWKGDVNKSGGLLMNIGIHLFDALLWLFGDVKTAARVRIINDGTSGTITTERAFATWALSTNGDNPTRTITVNGEEIDFTNGFTDLHTKSYQEIIAGRGFTVEDVAPSIELVNSLQK